MQMHREVLRMATPLVFNLLLDVAVVYTDFFMVAKLGSDAISAVGMGGQIWSIYYALLTLFYTGQSAIMTRYIGAKAYKKASLTLSTFILFGMAIGMPLMVIWYYLGANIFVWFGAPEGVLTLGQIYVQTMTLVAPLMILNAIFDTAITAYGNMKTSLYIKIAVVIVNAILDYLLIFGHGGFEAMGVKGAAIATVAAEILSFVVYVTLYLRSHTIYTPMVRFHAAVLQKVLRVGIPAVVERLISTLSYLIFTGIVLLLGSDVYAGFQIGFRLEGLAFMPGMAFAIVAAVLMGQGLGEKNPQKSRRAVIVSLYYAVSIMFTVSLLFMLMPETLGRFFTDDPEVLHQAALYLVIVGVSQVPLGMQFVLAKALNGAGDTRRTFLLSITSMWLVRIIPAMIAVYYFHSIVGVYLAMISDTFVKATLLWLRFKSNVWQTIRL